MFTKYKSNDYLFTPVSLTDILKSWIAVLN